MVTRFLGRRADGDVERPRRVRARRSRRTAAPRRRCVAGGDWQARGARLIIVTASPEIIVAPFARGLGADTLIGTRLAFRCRWTRDRRPGDPFGGREIAAVAEKVRRD